jgi:ABC-type lipoprotein export system ATPase subunit
MIKLEELGRVFKQGDAELWALAGIDLEVAQGQYLAIMGSSGSGKSTLLNILGCLDRPSQGSYRLEDTEVDSLDLEGLARLRSETFGFVFQQFHLLPSLTAQRNVMLPLIYAQEFPADAAERAAGLLTRVGLGAKLESKPHTLSGGQQQRVAIARALINRPRVILADEPTGNLDSTSGREVMDLFAQLHEQGGTIIMVTHDPLVADRAQRVVSLEDGRIVSDRPGSQGGSA